MFKVKREGGVECLIRIGSAFPRPSGGRRPADEESASYIHASAVERASTASASASDAMTRAAALKERRRERPRRHAEIMEGADPRDQMLSRECARMTDVEDLVAHALVLDLRWRGVCGRRRAMTAERSTAPTEKNTRRRAQEYALLARGSCLGAVRRAGLRREGARRREVLLDFNGASSVMTIACPSTQALPRL
jgi:hypothetical protein